MSSAAASSSGFMTSQGLVSADGGGRPKAPPKLCAIIERHLVPFDGEHCSFNDFQYLPSVKKKKKRLSGLEISELPKASCSKLTEAVFCI